MGRRGKDGLTHDLIPDIVTTQSGGVSKICDFPLRSKGIVSHFRHPSSRGLHQEGRPPEYLVLKFNVD